ncbi:NDP-hexose 2,3-dehydratase family protein [Nocardia sp. CNY236]|uniref:NDP-hexose 2,3-dehydratase family protein n=1 Tax=Nocardia sp. CNY236 TaxID=1169152 RepID=UPI0003F7B98E|nr:NDP-hexose 2,3-dehydratase family protein [Nocardia sp. CNY236]
MFDDLTAFHNWFVDRNLRNDYRVTVTSLDELDGWTTDFDSGSIRHTSGKFFSVEGIAVAPGGHDSRTAWAQPIIDQPEIGILGIIVTRVGDSFHCLMQAKMEPGNIDLVQLSPTVQATRSNYTRVHHGNAVPYLEYFIRPAPGSVVFDSLQSEQGSWFLGKRNRNMIVEVPDPLPAHDDFCWLSLDDVHALLRIPNLVNMDSRTVLSGLPFLQPPHRGITSGLAEPDGSPRHTLSELLSWFTDAKSRYRLERRRTPLTNLPEWEFSPATIHRPDGRHFTVIGVDVAASNREVARWSQPMVRPVDRGVIAFLGRRLDGEFHVLVHARSEAGTADVVEMGPTVACIPASYRDAPPAEQPRYLDVVQAATPPDILLDVVHSEEGGRFYQAENRYLVIDVGDDFPHRVPTDYCWMTVGQLTGFVRFGNHVNVAARCLLSCMADGVADRAVVAR